MRKIIEVNAMNSIFYDSTEQLLEKLNTASIVLIAAAIIMILCTFSIAFIACGIHENIKEIKNHITKTEDNENITD